MAFQSVSKRAVKYQVWDESQCAEVVNAAFRILERTGCSVRDERGRSILKEAGCIVQDDNVKIPRALLQWAIESAPSSIVIYDRKGNPAMNLSPWKVNFGPAITATKTIDVKTGEVRASLKEDAVNAALVMDALPNYAYVSALNSVSDSKKGLDDITELHAILSNTTKPILYWAHGEENLKLQFEMFEAVAGGEEAYRTRPFAVNLVCPIDPLVHTKEGVEQLIYMAEKFSPVVYIPGIAFGLSGPMTPAGGIAVGIADTLAGLVISQLVNKGTPFIVSKFNDNVNLQTSGISFSRPEQVVAQCATSDVFRYLDLPFCSNFGSTDSGSFDQIATFDKAMQIYSAYLSGANMVFGSGSFEAGTLTRLTDLVFCDEVIGYIKVMIEGIEITDETLAEDVIDEVGPGDNFLSSEHTVAHMREFWNPMIYNARTFEEATTNEKPSMDDTLATRVEEILEKGPSSPLPHEIATKLDEIMARAEM